MLHRAWKLISCLILLLFVQAHVKAQNDLTYVYDESGRLVAVIDPSGDTVKYAYDASGNLLSIARQSSALVSLLEFTPNTGPVGTQVTIYGTGFSTTASQNVVKFNGVAAVVTSATSTNLIAKVPSGATTGPISVSSPAGTVTSSASFIVGNTKAPTISGFTPAIGTPGTVVSVTGTNFRSPPSDNFLKLNIADSLTTSGTATTLVTSVPTNAGSGRIQVTTAYGKAVSKGDFFIPPSPYTPTNVQTTGRMPIGASKAVAISTVNKIGLILFDGVAGQRVSLQFSNVRFTSCQVKVYAPNTTELASAYTGTAGGFLDTPVLPADGTYAILVDPDSNYTGSLTLTLNSASDVSGVITANGAPLTLTTSVAGQRARATFSGTAGQRVSLRVTGVTTSTPGVALNGPDGANLAYFNVGTGGGFMDTQTLPLTGTYSILVDPSDMQTGSVTLTLYDVPPDSGSSLAVGSSATVTTTVPGQNAQLSFNASAGQKVSLGFSASSIPDGTIVTIYQPDATFLNSVYVNQGGSVFIDTQTLPVAGAYSIFIDPQSFNVGSMTVMMYSATEVKAAITAGGAALTLTTTYPGQNAKATFNGTAGQRVSLRVTGVTTSGTKVSLNRPDGTNLTDISVGAAGGFIDTQTLPVTGTYSILVDPSNTQTGSATLTLYKVPADASSAIAPGGAAATVTTTVPGQNARFTFNGTAGQVVSFNLWGNTIPDYTYVTLFRPNNVELASVSMYQGQSSALNAITLPVTGAYKITVDPQGDHTGRMTINDAPPATGTITPGGEALSVEITTPGQNAGLTFSGATGQRVSLAIFNVTIPSAVVYLKRPDGITLAQTFINTGGNFFIDTQTLPMAGTYSILLDPDDTYTGRATFALYNVVDVTGTITPDGAPVTVSTIAPGQRALLTFNATGGQKVFLKLSGVTTTNVHIVINKPGGPLAETSVGTGGGYIETQTIPFSGTYTILVDPEGTYTGSVTLSLYNVADVMGTIMTDGPSVSVATTTPGQNARLTFNGTAGQKISLSLSQVQFPDGVEVLIHAPDGTKLTSAAAYPGQNLLHDVPTLPLNGTYTIFIDPPNLITGNLTVALRDASDVSLAITPGGPPITLTTTTPGQNGRVTFSGTAGQRVSLKISGVTVSGTYVNFNRPDGANLLSVYTGTGGSFMDTQTLPVTGTYTLFVDPSDVQTGSVTLTLYDVPPDSGSSLAVGSSATITTTVPGQNARLSFNASAGQKVSLGFSAVTIPDYSYVTVYGPDGAQLASASVYQGGSVFIDTQTLPLTGTYTVLIDPQNANTGSSTLKLYDSSDVTGTVTPGGAAVRVNINTAGQNARLTFGGTAGWKVSLSLSQVTIPDSTAVTIYQPDGTQLAATSVYQAQTGLIDTQTLPLTGTYTIMIDPTAANIGGVTVKAVKH